MSAPTDRMHDPNSASFYAPTSPRTTRLGQVSEAAAALAATLDTEQAHDATAPTGGPFADPAIRRLRARHSLEPEPPSVPPVQLGRRTGLAIVGRLTLVVVAAATVALIAVGEFPFFDKWRQVWRQVAGDRAIELASSSRPAPAIATSPRPAATVATPRPEAVLPRLTVQDARANKGDPVPIGVTVQGPAEGAMIVVSGLVSGMTLSAGTAVAPNAWQVPASSLGDTWIQPPDDFVGSADLVAELRLADRTLTHRQPIHLEWLAPVAPAAAPAPAPVQHKLDREEIAVLLKRGQDLLARGDLAAARLVLLPAAEANDAEAALALAATYDPFVLQKLAVYGVSPNPALARAWYEKAREFGSAEAPRRLQVLANGVR